MKNNKNMQRSADYIPLKEKIAYGASEFYGGGSASLISLVLLFYLNYVVGLEAFVVGIIIFVSKAWDAVSDPLMGVISDNTRSKWGRRKPYMIVGGVLTLIAMVWLFAPISSLDKTAKTVSAIFAYIFFCTANTISQVPFCSLASDISPDQRERNKANTFKLLFSMIGAAVCFLIPSLLIDELKKNIANATDEIAKQSTIQSASMRVFLIIGLGFGLAFALVLIITGIFTKERTPYNKEARETFSFKSYIAPFKVKSYKWHLFMYIGAFLCMDIITALVSYYAFLVLPNANDPQALLFKLGSRKIVLGSTMLIAPMMISAALAIPLVLVIAKKKSKQLAFRIGLPLYILGGIVLASYQPNWSPWTVPVCATIMGIGLGGAQSMPWMVFPDTVDVAELKLGVRPTGTFSGLMTFSRKMTQAISILLIGIVFQVAGVVTKETGGFNIAPEKIASTAITVRVLMAFSIIALISFAFFASIKYKVTSSKLDRIRFFLDKAREGADVDVLTADEQKEKEELIKELA